MVSLLARAHPRTATQDALGTCHGGHALIFGPRAPGSHRRDPSGDPWAIPTIGHRIKTKVSRCVCVENAVCVRVLHYMCAPCFFDFVLGAQEERTRLYMRLKNSKQTTATTIVNPPGLKKNRHVKCTSERHLLSRGCAYGRHLRSDNGSAPNISSAAPGLARISCDVSLLTTRRHPMVLTK